ncbi:MAG: hypothetical protein R2795_22365 [Saprospiraceae bacterium]
MRAVNYLYVAGMVLLTACKPYSNADLAGQWQAISLTEEGDSLVVDLASIGFLFDTEGHYQFSSTLNYEEKGRYRLMDSYLFSTDSLRPPYKEKAVEIMRLSQDTLVLRMVDGDKERLMTLKKE